MKDLGQNFQTFDDARSRAVEILIAVGDEDATVLHGLQLAPARSMFKQRHLVKRSLYVKAARVHQNDIRVGDNKLVPIEPWRRLTRRGVGGSCVMNPTDGPYKPDPYWTPCDYSLGPQYPEGCGE